MTVMGAGRDEINTISFFCRFHSLCWNFWDWCKVDCPATIHEEVIGDNQELLQ